MRGTEFCLKIPIILIGGAAILANYGFRDMTTDVDAVIHAVSSMKEAINHVGDKFHLPNGWLNADFMKTGSYSPKLEEFSVHYREFSNVLEVRTISAENSRAQSADRAPVPASHHSVQVRTPAPSSLAFSSPFSFSAPSGTNSSSTVTPSSLAR